MNAKEIISKFGGQTALAAKIGKGQSTVAYWAKTGVIPARWWPKLTALAQAEGITLNIAELIENAPKPLVGTPDPDPVPAVVADSQPDLPQEVMEAVTPGSNFLFYQGESGNVRVRVLLDAETVWLTQRDMAELFDVTVQNVNLHLQNILYRDSELDESVIKKSLITGRDGKSYETSLYNLDAIISVGYRVNSYTATQFRRWATGVLKSYMIKGFALDDERLKQGKSLFGRDYFNELLERIRAIRASERRFYQKITDIFAQCSIDYDKNSPVCKRFYAHVQDKLHHAITGHTAAELVHARADATKPHMGLTSWKNEGRGGNILKSDVTTGKSYLKESELSKLNRLVSMYLDFAEGFAERQIPLTMAQWEQKLDGFLRFNEYDVLDGYGRVSRENADRKALAEFEKYRVIQDAEYESDFDRVVREIKAEGRLPAA